MKRWLLLILACLCCCSSKEEKPYYLFVIQAESGTIVKVENGYELKMSGLPEKMVMFSDRPFREAKFIRIDDFIDHWDKGEDSFKDDPPNASLNAAFVDEEDGDQAMHVVEIFDPRYANGSLTFHMKSIHEGLPLKEAEVKKVVLVIDRVGL